MIAVLEFNLYTGVEVSTVYAVVSSAKLNTVGSSVLDTSLPKLHHRCW